MSGAVPALLEGLARGLRSLSSIVVFLSLTALSLFFLLKDAPTIRRFAERQLRFPPAVAHGMTPAQALRAGLVTGAAELGFEDDLGALAPGRLADVIAIDGDPLRDISALREVRFVMKGGRVHRTEPAPVLRQGAV